MSEKEKKSLIIISSVFIFVLVFMVFFTFYRRDAMLSDRTIPKINTEYTNIVPEEDPPSLGDTCGYTCSKGTLSGTTCYEYTSGYRCGTGSCSSSMSSSTPCCPGGSFSNGMCFGGDRDGKSPTNPTSCTYRSGTYEATYSCTSCDAGKYLSSGSCKKCDAGYYCQGGSANRVKCSAGEYSKSGARECSQCNGSKEYSSVSGATSCSICEDGYHANSSHTGCVADVPSCETFTTQGACEGEGCYWNSQTSKCTSSSSSTVTPTPNTCSIAHCSSYASKTNENCKCSVCENGYYTSSTGACLANATATPTPTVKERPSYCLSSEQCFNDANNKCVGIKSGCTKVATIDGYDCYSYTCEKDRPLNCPSQAECVSTKCTYGVKEECHVTETIDGVDCYKHTCNEAPADTGNCCYQSGGEYKYVLTTRTACTNTYGGTDESQINCLAKNSKSGDCEQFSLSDCPSRCLKTSTSCKTPVSCDSLPCCYTGSDGVARNVYDSTVCQDKTVDKKCGACPGQPTPSLDYNDCSITSFNIISKSVSVDSDDYQNNSYYVALVSVSGSGCSKNSVTLVTDNGKPSPSSRVITSSSETATFVVYPSTPCQPSTVYARLSNGKTSEEKSIDVIADWTKKEGCFRPNGETLCGSKCNTSFADADKNGENEYYSSWDNVEKCYTEHWTRGCDPSGGSSSNTPTPTPILNYACYANAKDLINATKTIWATSGSTSYPYLISGVSKADCKAYACFVNSDGTDYKWANTTPSGYKKVDSILSRSLCKPEENACYIDGSGEYHWGKYKNNSQYTFVASITDETKCKKMDGAACYSNGDKYVWDTTSPGDNYVKVPELDTPLKCAKDDNGCFLHNNKYAWGNYFNKSDYYYVAGITEQEYCSNYGCYVNNNEYVWGDYSDDDSYKLVADITDRTRCGYTPDVPKTSLNTQMIVYIATAIMSVAGIYFVVRYNNKSKNI